MNGRHRNAMNAQIWEMKNDSNYDGNCTARHCLSGTYEISRRWIFVGLSVQTFITLNLKTIVRGFKPGRSHRIFRAKKILSMPSFRGKVKPLLPCRRFAACKRSLNLRGSGIQAKLLPDIFLAHSSTFPC